MNRKKFLRPLIMFSVFGGLVVTSMLLPNNDSNVTQAQQELRDDNFISVDNFLYSGLGLQMEFTFEVPKGNVTNKFSFVYEKPDHSWLRLTEIFNLTFKADGSVTTNMGNVFCIDDVYYYQLLFKDLNGHLNKDDSEKPTGHETLNIMYFNNYNIEFNSRSCSTISSTMNAYPKAEIRDGTQNGLRFRSHFKTLDSTSTYGHIIVPNHFVAKYNSDYINHLNNDGRTYLDIPCTPTKLSSSDELYEKFGAGYSIAGSIINIDPGNYQLPYCAIPYEKLSDNSYVYGNLVKATKCSLYEVCNLEKENGAYDTRTQYGKNYINSTITSCDVHTTPITSLTHVSAFAAKNSEQIMKSSSLSGDEPTTVELVAGRNEKESGQIMLYSTSCTSNYYVNFEPFVSSSSSYKIPSKNVKVYQELYQDVNSNWTEYNNVSGAYVSGKETLPLGWFPDALLPFETSIDSGENYLSITNGNMNGIYFTIEIPKDTPSGTYTSNAVIKINGEGTIVMPINLTVKDFTLPDQNHSNMITMINTTELGYVYPDSYVSFDSIYYKTAFEKLEECGVSGGQLPQVMWSKDDLATYIKTCKEYASNPNVSTFLFPNCYQNLDVDFTFSYQQIITKSVTINLKNYPIYVGKDYIHTEGGKDYQMYGIETLLTEMVKASTNEVDLLKKGVFYFPQADEPGSDLADQVQNLICQHVVLKAAQNVLSNTKLFEGKQSVKRSLENIYYFVTSQPRELLKGVYKVKVNKKYVEYPVSLSSITPQSDNCYLAYLSNDINDFYKDEDGSPLIHMKSYCPQYDCYQYYNGGENTWGYQDIMSMLNDDDYNMWWYGCCMPVAPYPTNSVNAPMIRYRTNKWLEFKYGVKGSFYYMCNRGSSVLNDEYGQEQSTPKTEAEILAGQADYNSIHGDGIYIYPVHNLYKDIDNSIYWLSSLRLEILREGKDDYNYLYYANELIRQLPISEQDIELEHIDDYISALTSGAYYNSKNHNDLYTQKVNLANLIANLESRVK